MHVHMYACKRVVHVRICVLRSHQVRGQAVARTRPLSSLVKEPDGSTFRVLGGSRELSGFIQVHM